MIKIDIKIEKYSGSYRRNEQSSNRSRTGSSVNTNRDRDRIQCLNIGCMIILQKNVQMYEIERQNSQSSYSKCLIWKKT